MRVVHSTNVWLSQTMTWLHTQVGSLPSRVESWVVCDRVQNLDQFPVGNLVTLDRDGWLWRALGSRSWTVAKLRHDYLLKQTLGSDGQSLLHSHFGDRGWSNVDLARRSRVRHVVTFYGYDVSRLPYIDVRWRERYRKLFDTADLFLCEGPHLAKCLVDLGCPGSKVKVHHLGVDLARVCYRPRVWRSGETLRVLIAGTFVEKKGIPDAVMALGRMRRRTPLQVVIIGDSNGQERSQIEKRRIMQAIADAGLSSVTQVLGFQPHEVLLRIAHECHVFLSPSVTASDGDTEGGAPVSVIEMAATGMPVVSTTHCDIPEVLEAGVTGWLAAEHDVDGLEERLCWLIDNPERWGAMVAAARRHIEAEFDAVAQGARLGGIYESIGGG